MVFAFFFCPNNDFWFPYRQLESIAEPENWESYEKENGVRKFPEGNLEILSSYLNQTFLRLQEESKILYSEDGTKACFNTGLLGRNYGGEIFAFFDRNTKPGQQDWHFIKDGFVTERDAMRCNFMKGFLGQPQAAEYYNAENYRDLFFNLEYKSIVIAEHIVEENMARLPLSLQSNSHMAFNTIQGAVKSLYDKLRRNYKLAVPHWYDGHIQLLLPLYLTDPHKPDLALVAQRNDDQRCYVIKTILTMDWAYKDARIICRPDSDWLKS